MIRRFTRELTLDTGLFVIRAMLGIVFLFHGGQKLFGLWEGSGLVDFAAYLEGLEIPAPAVAAVLAGAAELWGGLALITGAWMRFSILPLIATMVTAIVFVHPHTFAIQSNGMEYPLTLAVVLLGLLLTGPGRFQLLALFPNRPLPTLSQPVEA